MTEHGKVLKIALMEWYLSQNILMTHRYQVTDNTRKILLRLIHLILLQVVLQTQILMVVLNQYNKVKIIVIYLHLLVNIMIISCLIVCIIESGTVKVFIIHYFLILQINKHNRTLLMVLFGLLKHRILMILLIILIFLLLQEVTKYHFIITLHVLNSLQILVKLIIFMNINKIICHLDINHTIEESQLTLIIVDVKCSGLLLMIRFIMTQVTTLVNGILKWKLVLEQQQVKVLLNKINMDVSIMLVLVHHYHFNMLNMMKSITITYLLLGKLALILLIKLKVILKVIRIFYILLWVSNLFTNLGYVLLLVIFI